MEKAIESKKRMRRISDTEQRSAAARSATTQNTVPDILAHHDNVRSLCRDRAFISCDADILVAPEGKAKQTEIKRLIRVSLEAERKK